MPPIRVSGQGSKSVYVNYFSVEAEALPPGKKHASVMCLIFVNALQTLKYISDKDILPTFDTSDCSSLRRLGYQTNAQGLKIRPILQRNAATLLEFIFLIWPTLKTSWARRSKNLWIHLPCKLMMWQKIVRGNVSQITWDCKRGMLWVISKKGGCLLWHLKIWSRLAIPHPFLFCFNYFPLPFGLNLATLQLCAWCMFLSYTNSWGAPIVGPGHLLTFTIFSHHSFKCTDPTTRVRGCVITGLWVHARVLSGDLSSIH